MSIAAFPACEQAAGESPDLLSEPMCSPPERRPVMLVAGGVALLLVVGAILRLALITDSGGDLRITGGLLMLAGVVRILPPVLTRTRRPSNRLSTRNSAEAIDDGLRREGAGRNS